MAVQQNKMSKTRYRRRKAANRYKGIQANVCSRCGASRLSHCVCKSCGFYNNKQIVSIET